MPCPVTKLDLSRYFTSAEAFQPLRKEIFSVLRVNKSGLRREELEILLALSQVTENENGFLQSLRSQIVQFDSYRVDQCVRRLIERVS